MKLTYAASRSLLLMIGAAVFLSASAQGPHVGLKGGITLSNLYDSEVDDDNMRFGFNVGVMGRTDAEQAIGFQGELLYTTCGNSTNYDVLGVQQTVDFNLGYLQLPLMVSFRLLDGAFAIQAGGYASLLLSAKSKTEGDLGTDEQDLDKDNFNTVDAGLVGGVAFNAGALQIGARYNYGLAELADSEAADLLLGDAKNSFTQIYIAVGMP